MGNQRRRARKAAPAVREGLLPWVQLLVFLAAIGLYVNTLNHAFVFDDVSLIAQNPEVKNLRWGDILGRGGYRPVRTFSYAVNYALGGENPFGYHLFNVALHAVNVLLVAGLFWSWSRSNVVAGVGALFFAVHPAQTAAVAYISGRKDLLSLLFMVLGCRLFTSFRHQRRPLLIVSAWVCFTLGILSKEVVIVFPVLVLLMDALVLRQGPDLDGSGVISGGFWKEIARAVQRSPALHGVFLLFSGVALYYAVFLVEASRMVGYWGGSWATNLGTGIKLFQHYLKLALFPYPLVADYLGDVFDVSTGLLEPATLLALAGCVSYALLALWTHRHSPRVAFGMLWFLVTLVPVLQIVPFHELAADHFLYMPLLGFSFVAGVGVDYLIHRRRINILAWGATAAVGLIFAVMTIDRNRDWKDEFTLWEATYQKAPGSYRANMNLGVLHHTRGDLTRAIEHTKRSLELDPSRVQAWSNLGGLCRVAAVEARQQGDLDRALALDEEARGYLEKAIRLQSKDPWALANLGQVYRDLGLIWELRGQPEKALETRTTAIRQFQRALAIPSDHEQFPRIWFELAKVFMDGGYYDQAVHYLNPAIQAFPNDPSMQYAMGTCFFNQRRYREAVPHFERVTRLEPTMESWGMLAKAYEEIGESDSAIRTYQHALSQFPGSVQIHYNLGVLFHRIGDADVAVQHLERALALEPRGALAPNIRMMLDMIKGHVSG